MGMCSMNESLHHSLNHSLGMFGMIGVNGNEGMFE